MIIKDVIFRFIKSPFNCLAVLWFLTSVRVFFDLDMLRAMPGNINMHSYGRGKKPNAFEANITYSEMDGVESAANFTSYLSMHDFSYSNNMIDEFFDLVDLVGILVEGP